MKTVPMRGKKAAGRVALVDDEDYDLVMQYRWYVYEEIRNGRPHGPYALAWPNGVMTRMHVLVMGVRGVDHANRNGLDNRRENLRPATGSQNQGNRRSVPGSSSRYKGVSWHKQRRKWRASIRPPGGPHRHLGLFADEEDAARVYDAAAREAFGSFACLNFPDVKDGSDPEALGGATDAA